MKDDPREWDPRATQGPDDTSQTKDDSTEQISKAMEVIRTLQAIKDPTVKYADVGKMVGNWAHTFAQCWHEGDMQPCRSFMTDGLYHHVLQLSEENQAGSPPSVEKISIKLSPDKWGRRGDTLFTSIKVGVTEYYDNKSRLRHMTFIWELTRTRSNQEVAGWIGKPCPACGATSVDASGRCAYCGSPLGPPSHDWLLSSIEDVSNTAEETQDQ